MHPRTENANHARNHGTDVWVAHDEVHHPHLHQNRQGVSSASRSMASWFSDDEELSPRASRYYNDLFSLYTQRHTDAVVPDSNREANSHIPDAQTRTTAVPGAVARDFALESADIEQRPTTREKTTSAANQSFFKKQYRTAKDIYRNGPPGEAQLFWEGIKSCLDERQKERDVIEMCSFDESATALQRPPLEPEPRKRGVTAPRNTHMLEKRETRQDSAISYGEVSRTSREVPIKLRRTVLTVNVNKPLPPPPLFSIATQSRSQKGKGKVLGVNKPLPRTPFPCSLDKSETVDDGRSDSPLDTPWTSPNVPKAGSEAPVHASKSSRQSTRTSSKQTTQEAQQPTTYKSLQEPPPKARQQDAGKYYYSKQEAARAALKASISLPVSTPSPPRGPDPYIVSRNGKGRHRKTPSTPTWFNKLAHPTLPTMVIHKHHSKKRPDSDESFACQGLSVPAKGEVSMYEGDGGECVVVGGPRMRLDEGLAEREKVFRPQALFTGSRADGSLNDVGHVWPDARATGRWI